MKIETIRRLIMGCFALSLALCVGGCGGKVEGYTVDKDQIYHSDDPIAAVVILGNHANAMAIPDDAYKCMDEILDKVVYGGYMCAVVSDGKPTKVDLVEDDFFKEDARNAEILEKRIRARKPELIDRLKSVAPADDMEVDLLQAIREAKNALSTPSVEAIQNKQIIIIDTGVSTTGSVDFTTMDVLSGKPVIESVIQILQVYEGVGVLPDLNGVSVSIIGTSEGMAEAAFPQVLTTTDKKYIKELWSSIVTACGAKEVSFYSAAGWDTPNVYTEDEQSKFLYVTAIPFYHDSIIDFSKMPSINTSDPDNPPVLPPPPEVSVNIKSEEVGFKPDSPNFYNENAVLQLLKPYSLDLQRYFEIYPKEKIWIVGTSATTKPGGDGSVRLSLQRAETVKKTLIELGAPADNTTLR